MQSEKIKALASGMGVLQGKKDEVERRLSDRIVENEEILSRMNSLLEKMETMEDEREIVMKKRRLLREK